MKCVPYELLVRDTILVLLRSRLAGEERGELLVEVDQVPRILAAFEFVLDNITATQQDACIASIDAYRLQEGGVGPPTEDMCKLPGYADMNCQLWLSGRSWVQPYPGCGYRSYLRSCLGLQRMSATYN